MRTFAVAAAMLLAIPALALAQADTTPGATPAPMSQPADGATSGAMPMHHAARHHRKHRRHHKHMSHPAAAPVTPAL